MNRTCHNFSGYKQRNKVPLVCLECKLQHDRHEWIEWMNFEVKMPQNGRKNIFRDKQTTKKVPLIFLDVQVVTER